MGTLGWEGAQAGAGPLPRCHQAVHLAHPETGGSQDNSAERKKCIFLFPQGCFSSIQEVLEGDLWAAKAIKLLNFFSSDTQESIIFFPVENIILREIF